MNEISRLGRNKVALASADGTKAADNDACGRAPADTGSLVPPTQSTQGSPISIWRAPRVLVPSSEGLTSMKVVKREPKNYLTHEYLFSKNEAMILNAQKQPVACTWCTCGVWVSSGAKNI